MSKIVVIVDAEGDVTVETIGMKGAKCKEVSKFLEKAIGQLKSDKNTRDFYMTHNDFQREVN